MDVDSEPLPNIAAPLDGNTPLLPEPEQEEGLLSKIGYVLDTPGAYLRGLLSGHPLERKSGQELLQSWGAIDKPSDTIFSGEGAAGLAAEMVLDPLNLLFGLGALTKVGKAANVVGKGLKTGETLSAAQKAGRVLEAGKDYEKLAVDALTGVGGEAGLADYKAAKAAGKTLEAAPVVAEQVGPASMLGGQTHEAGKLLAEQGKLGAVLENPDLVNDFGAAGEQGMRSLLGFGGEHEIIPFVKKSTVNLPEKTLIQGAPVLAGLQKAGQYVKAAPGVKQVLQLLTGGGRLEGEAAEDVLKAKDDARRAEQAGQAEAADQAMALGHSLRDPQLLEDVRKGGLKTTAGELVDPLTGEIKPAAKPPLPPLDLPVQDLGPSPSVSLDPFTGERRPELGPIQPKATQLETPLPGVRDIGAAPADLSHLPESDAFFKQPKEAQVALERKALTDLPPELKAPPIPVPTPEALRTPGVMPEPGFDPFALKAEKLDTAREALARAEAKQGVKPFEKPPLPSAEEMLGAGSRDERAAVPERAPSPASSPLEGPPALEPGAMVGGKALSAGDAAGMQVLDEAKAAAKRMRETGMEEGQLLAVEGRAAREARAKEIVQEGVRRSIEAKNAAEKGAAEELLGTGRQEALSGKPKAEPPPGVHPDYVGVKSDPTLSRSENFAQMKAQRDRNLAQQQAEAVAKEQGRMADYLRKVGFGTVEAAEQAAKLFPKDSAPEVMRAISDALENGTIPAGKLGEHVQALRSEYDAMFKAEQEMAVKTPGLKDSIQYAPHVATKEGARFFRGLKPEGRAQLFKSLAEARAARGLPLKPGEFASQLEDTAQEILRKPEGAATKAVPKNMRGHAEALFKGLAPETRAWLEQNGLKADFLAYDSVMSTVHESQIPRLLAYKGLPISELNDVFKKHGARSAVFSEDPAVQLFVRKARHEQVKAANDFFEMAGARAGDSFKPGEAFGTPAAEGINVYKTPSGETLGYGMAEANKNRMAAGKSAVVFPDLKTAQEVQRVIVNKLTPEEVGPVLKWYDDMTRGWKSWVTKGFPAYHIRNRISNRLQSWLVDVPPVGEHFDLANKAMAGKEISVTLPNGVVLNREQVMDLARKEGVLQNGFFEAELKERAGRAPESSWNPFENGALNPNFKPLKAAEKASSALAAAPGALISGTAGNLSKASAEMVEGTDRLGHFIYELEHGKDSRQAGESVEQALFDYSKTGEFEKNILQRGVFFYTYTRKALPFILDRMLNRPEKVTALMRIGGQTGEDSELPEYLPPWVREAGAHPMGHDAQGKPIVLTGIDTPVSGAFSPFTGFGEGFQRGSEKLLGQLNPLLKNPLELATGRDFFLGRGIEENRKAPHWADQLPEGMLGARHVESPSGATSTEMDPFALFALNSSPAGRLSTTAGKLMDADKGALEKAVNLLTGAKASSIDEEREAYLAQKRANEARLREMERQGLVRETPIFSATQAGKEGASAAEIKALTRRKAKEKKKAG